MRTAPRPVVLFAFANNRMDPALYLRNLPEEQRRVREAMTAAEQAGLCEIVERANATAAEVLDVFQDARYRDRVAIFHFGGHAGSGALLFESPEGAPRLAHAAGLARFLGEQRGLALVFLNGCSTQGQVQGLLAAGVPVVIATSQAILDSVATELSARFYQALASGAPLRAAFEEATAAVQALTGDLPAGTYANLHPGPLVPLVQDRWPWDLHVAPGAEEEARRWSLPRVVWDPLFGLPPLPAMDLPLSPFKHLAPFTRADAPVFFGRGREIRELYEEVTRPEGAPLVLLFGATGAGKSSLLAAGLQPRLEASHQVLYLRRDRAFGLAGTLARALGDEDVDTAWRRKEAAGKPLAVILDQAEEAWTRPLARGGEVEAFSAVLRALFAVRETRPRGRLVLGFRKEWLAEVLQLLDAEKLPRTRVEVTHLDRDAIEEVVLGPASGDRLRRHYGLEVDPELPARIAGDLAGQGAATIAPILQILLTQMWKEVEVAAIRRFKLDLYERMKRRGLLLDDFLEEQLRGLREQWPEAVDSGLVLDLLFFHTTPLGTAESRSAAEVAERYGHRPEIPELVGQCKDRYLLVGGGEDREAKESDRPMTRLAHDTLAPLVRRRFESSDLPGQRALRILLRAEEWTGARSGEPLGELDLARVEEGKAGMRVRTQAEEQLVEASRIQVARRRRQRRSLQLAAVAAVALILGAAFVFRQQRQQARVAEERARDRAYAALGANLLVDHPTEASLVTLEIRQPDSTPTANDLLEKALANPVQTATLTGHTDPVWAASFSPDGTRVVTASFDDTARIWNATTGQLIATLTGHTDALWAASFSPDSTRVVTASEDKTARIWNAVSGQLIATLTGHTDSVWAASFSPDSTRVVTASKDKTAWIWNAANGKPIATLTGHTEEVEAASFSPDGTRVATASSDKTARIWNAATGRLVATLTGHTDSVWAASFSPDGNRVVTASKDKKARIWNAATGQPIATLTGHTEEVEAASFSPDGKRVVTASSDEKARVWNAATGLLIATLTGHTDGLHVASFSPDGTRVVTASRDKTARVWNVATGQLIATLTGHTAEVHAASFSLDGTRVVTASWDYTARIWDAASGQPLATFTGHTGAFLAASFSPDGWVVTTSDDDTAQIWNAATGQLISTLTGHAGPFFAASFSPDGTRVVTTSGDDTAQIWNAATGQLIRAPLTEQTGAFLAASFSPDGTRVVTASDDFTAQIWNAATDQVISTLTGHKNDVRMASFSPDGTRVVTASDDKTARVWNAATGQPIVTLTGHTAEVRAASFSSDGTRVVTGSKDQTARIWSVAEEYMQGLIRARTTLCLPAPFRQQTLGETPQEAESHEKACQACVPKFFARVKGVPVGDAQTYIAAWRAYRGCLDRAR
jgi:WD40 repeat protein